MTTVTYRQFVFSIPNGIHLPLLHHLLDIQKCWQRGTASVDATTDNGTD